jgi:DNA-binding GntR family transcriptional regulator
MPTGMLRYGKSIAQCDFELDSLNGLYKLLIMRNEYLPKTRQEAAAETLRRAITGGIYNPGQRLKQMELARELGCSVIPIREALHQLAVEGFVVMDPQRGARVVDLNCQTLEEICEVRMLLEGFAARRAAKRMTPPATERIQSILHKMDDPNITPDEWLRLNMEFHDSLYACSEQEFLRKMISNLRLTMEPYLRLDLATVADYASGRREHRRIFDACMRRDARAAARYAAAHLRRTLQGVIKYLRRHSG